MKETETHLRGPAKTFGYGHEQGKHREPDYARVIGLLSDRELADEIAAGRGAPGYQEALREAHARRQGRATGAAA